MMIIAATFALVFLRAIQQQNVIGGHYIMSAVVSYAIAYSDVFVTISVVAQGMDVAFLVGTGGALGVTSAMYVHRKFRR